MKLSETLLQVDPYSGVAKSGAKKKRKSLHKNRSYACMSDENIGSDIRDGKKGIQYSQVYSKYGFPTDVNEAKKLFDEKVSELDCMSEDTYKEETLGLQLLRDFITENEIKKDKPVEIISDSITRASRVLSYSFDVEERENGKSADSKSRERKKSYKGVAPIAGISKSNRNDENMPPEDIPVTSQLIERGDLEGLMEKSEELSFKSHLFYKSAKTFYPQSGSMRSAPQSGSMYSAAQSVGMFHGAIQGVETGEELGRQFDQIISAPIPTATPLIPHSIDPYTLNTSMRNTSSIPMQQSGFSRYGPPPSSSENLQGSRGGKASTRTTSGYMPQQGTIPQAMGMLPMVPVGLMNQAVGMPQSHAMPMPQASGMFKYLATDDMSPPLLYGKSIPQKPFSMDQASNMPFESLSGISLPQPTISARSGMSDSLQPMTSQPASFGMSDSLQPMTSQPASFGMSDSLQPMTSQPASFGMSDSLQPMTSQPASFGMSDSLQPMTSQPASFGMSGLSFPFESSSGIPLSQPTISASFGVYNQSSRPQSNLSAGVEAKQQQQQQQQPQQHHQQQQQHFECSEAVPVLPTRRSLSPPVGRAPKPTSKLHGSLLTAYAPPPPPAPSEPPNPFAKSAPPPFLANYAPPPPIALSTPLPPLANYAPLSEIQGMMYSRQIARGSLERSPRKSGGSKILRKEKEQRAPVLDECLDLDDKALGMSLEMSMEIGNLEDARLMDRSRQLSSDARFTDTRSDEQERSPRRSSAMMLPSSEKIAPSLPDMDTISEKIFSLQREEGNWEISDLSVISVYLHKSTEQILQEIAQSGAKSLGASVYSKLLHFIPTLILLFFLHTAYPRSFELSPSFISWTVIPPKWKPPGDKALSFIRLFNKQNPSLSSRLDLATSWYQYAEKQIKTPDQ